MNKDNKYLFYLEKIKYYTSVNNIYKIDKYNHKLSQLGGKIKDTDIEKFKIDLLKFLQEREYENKYDHYIYFNYDTNNKIKITKDYINTENFKNINKLPE